MSLVVAAARLRAEYARSTTARIQLIDTLLALSATTAALQAAYCAVAGTFPFNSFLAGFMSSVGVFVLTGAIALRRHLRLVVSKCQVHLRLPCCHLNPFTARVGFAASLRLQLTDTKEFGARPANHAFAEWLLGCVVLFLASLNWMG